MYTCILHSVNTIFYSVNSHTLLQKMKKLSSGRTHASRRREGWAHTMHGSSEQCSHGITAVSLRFAVNLRAINWCLCIQGKRLHRIVFEWKTMPIMHSLWRRALCLILSGGAFKEMKSEPIVDTSTQSPHNSKRAHEYVRTSIQAARDEECAPH